MSKHKLLVPNPRSEAHQRALVFVWIWTKRLKLPKDVAKLVGQIVRKDIVLNVGDKVANWFCEYTWNGYNWTITHSSVNECCTICRMPCSELFVTCLKHAPKFAGFVECSFVKCEFCDSSAHYCYYDCHKHVKLNFEKL